jgi:hypothetical protein
MARAVVRAQPANFPVAIKRNRRAKKSCFRILRLRNDLKPLHAAPLRGAWAVIALSIAAALVIGLVLGWALTASLALAKISRSQERMERKVRYWQAETALARQEAERLARRLDTGSN